MEVRQIALQLRNLQAALEDVVANFVAAGPLLPRLQEGDAEADALPGLTPDDPAQPVAVHLLPAGTAQSGKEVDLISQQKIGEELPLRTCVAHQRFAADQSPRRSPPRTVRTATGGGGSRIPEPELPAQQVEL